MARLVPTVDPQLLELDALDEACGQAFENLIEAGLMEPGDVNFYYEDEPESHVFCQSDLDEMYGGDFDEAYETVMAVGAKDVDAKIRHRRRILDRLRAIENGD